LDTTTLTYPVEKIAEIPKKKESQKQNNLGYVKAKFDFQGQDDEDLPFKKGDILEIIKKQEEKWWTARNSAGKSGSIPVPYVEVTFSVTNDINQERPNSMPEVNSPNNSRPPSLNDANRTVWAKVIMRRVPNVYDPEALPLEVLSLD
jgi:proto-oncogene C-crk